MMHSNSRANDQPKPTRMPSQAPKKPSLEQRQGPLVKRAVSVPRPTPPASALRPGGKPTTPPQLRLVSEIPKPPPAPRRKLAKQPPPLPPPLPEPLLLSEADLVDEAVEPTTSVAPTTLVDHEVGCFSRTEAPPQPTAKRTRAWVVAASGLALVAATGLLFSIAPLALKTLTRGDAADRGVARAPAMMTMAALSTPPSPVVPPRVAAPSDAPRPKLSAHTQRSKTGVGNPKKPSKPTRSPRVSPKGAASH